MRKKRRLLSIVVMGGLLGGLAWVVLRSHEQIYQGKPLSRWLLEAYDASHQSGESSEPKIEGDLRTLGTKALPTLIDMASTRNSGVTLIVGEMAEAKEFAFLHLPRQSTKHETAAWALKILGPQAGPAVPALISLLNDRNLEVRKTAAQCLAGIGAVGQQAAPALIAALSRTSTNREQLALRAVAIHALGEMGPAARSAIPQLAAITNDLEAEFALLRIKGESLVPFIEQLTNISHPGKWHQRASLISGLATNAELAVPLFIKSLSGTNGVIQLAGIEALGKIHSRPEVCLP